MSAQGPRDWEVLIVTVPTGAGNIQTLWNKECVDGWEPFAVVTSNDQSQAHIHFKRRRDHE